MSSNKITVEKQGHILLIGLNRAAKRNAFDIEMYSQLSQAYMQLEMDSELRCGVLFAHGDHFTAGLELPKWVDTFSSGDFPFVPEGGLDPLGIDPVQRVTKPIVMAVQGYCLTLGIELLLATDIRVAATDTQFAQIEIKRGIYPVGGATIRLYQEVGWGNAMRYLLTADSFTAEEAYRMGLVQEVVAPGLQVETAVKLAETIAKQAPLGVYATLKSARIARWQGERAAFDQLMPDMQPLMQSEDVQEGVQSFIERREAKFVGK